MHDPIPSQGQWLRQVVTGFFAYHAVPTNFDALAAFRYHIMVLWMRTLTRRSQKDHTGWDRINRLADQWLPKPRILHPWPNQRFAWSRPSNIQGGSRMRECRTSGSGAARLAAIPAGASPANTRSPVHVVVIPSGREGDQTAESLEVKALWGRGDLVRSVKGGRATWQAVA